MAETEESATRLEDMTIRLGPLLKILECTVCLEVVNMPSKSCQRGHLVCNECTNNSLLNCPTCQAEFTMENHVIVKNIVEMLPRACCYAGNGCKEVVLPEPGAHDERFCGFRPIWAEEFRVMAKQQHLLAHEFKKHALDFARKYGISTHNNAIKNVAIKDDKYGFSGKFWFSLYDDQKYNVVPHFEYDTLFLLKFTKEENKDFVKISFSSCFIGKPVDDVSILITFKRPNEEHVELRVTLKACTYGETDSDIIKLSQATVRSDMTMIMSHGVRKLIYNYEIFRKQK